MFFCFCMNEKFVARIKAELTEIETAGLLKKERIITSPQGPEITVNGKKVLNFCANNYLGFPRTPGSWKQPRNI
jgi:glycine C-acetyltransferase